MNRRKFLAAMAAGAIVTAEGLWIPGQKLISIPKSRAPIRLIDRYMTINDTIHMMPGDMISGCTFIAGDGLGDKPFIHYKGGWVSNVAMLRNKGVAL